MRFAILVWTVASMLLAGATVAAQDVTDDQARDAFQAGVEHYEAGRLDEALTEFRRAYELKPSWKILFNIGQCEAAAGRYGLALDMFERYIVEGGDEVPNDRRDFVSAEVRRIQPMVGVLEVEAPDGTAVIVDDLERKKTPLKGPLRVAAGIHEVRLIRGEEVLLSDTVTVAGGVTTRVEAPEPEGPPAVEPAEEPAATPAEEAPPPLPRRKKAFLIAGLSTFGGGYLLAALVGYLLYTEATVPEGDTCINCKSTGKRMFIPVVGPFLAIEEAHDDASRAVCGIMGGVQVTGLGLTVVGVILFVQSGPPDEPEDAEATEATDETAESAGLGRELHPLARLRLGAAPADGGGTLSLGWTF